MSGAKTSPRSPRATDAAVLLREWSLDFTIDAASPSYLVWRQPVGRGRGFRRAGAPAGGLNNSRTRAQLARGRKPRQEWVVTWRGHKYKTALIVFVLHNGRMPTGTIDHIDGNSLNNAPDNLREATTQQQNWNRARVTKTW